MKMRRLLVEVLVPESEDAFNDSEIVERAIEHGLCEQVLYINSGEVDALVLSESSVNLDPKAIKRIHAEEVEHRANGCDDHKCKYRVCRSRA